MFKKFADGFQSTLAQAGEQAKARNGIPGLGGSSSPRPSATIERPLTTNGTSHIPYEEGNLDSENEEDATKQSGQPSDADNSEARKSLTSEQSPDLQKRLSKLAKYEKKYPELLKAYRALQTQDLNVKSFEKVLGDITPATSILDVEAFQQWANNFTLKANMSVEELRRVSKEVEDLQADAKTRTLQTDEETSILKNRINELETTVRSAQSVSPHAEPSNPNEGTEDRQESLKAHHEQVQALVKQRNEIQAELDFVRKAKSAIEDELAESQKARVDNEEKLRTSEARRVHAQDIARSEYAEIEESRDKLRRELTDLKLLRTNEIEQHSSALSQNTSTPQEGSLTEEPIEPEVPLSKGQKKRKNKRKQISPSTAEVVEHVKKETEMLDDHAPQSEANVHEAILLERNRLRLELETLKIMMESSDEKKQSLERKVSQLQEHSESINDMRDMLKDIGNELVDAKDRIKALIAEKATLHKSVEDTKAALQLLEGHKMTLEAQLAESKAVEQNISSNINDKTVQNELEIRLEASEDRLRTISRDLEIAEKLSAERFKELSSTKENFKTQNTELQEIKRQAAKLTSEKGTLETSLKSTEAKGRALERAEKDRRDELEKSQRNLTSREKELKVIQTAFKEEELRRKSEESRAAGLKSEVAKLTALRDSIISSRSELTSQLASMRADLDAANTKMAALQQTKNQLRSDRDAAQEELQLGKAKFESSFSLMESQREQTVDMQHRLRETTDRHEAMEEELSEAHRQLTERGREAETLRRLLSEIESGQESRLREMRERMEVALAERDKAEDEAAFTGKKRAREVEELKETLRDVERVHRKLVSEQEDLLVKLKGSNSQMELTKLELDAKDKDSKQLSQAMTELSHSLREAESQISSLEEERGILRQTIKDATHKVERMTSEITSKDDLLNKLRNEKAHLLDRQESSQSPTQIRRTSHQRNDSIPSVPGSPAFLRSPSLQSVSLFDKPKEKAEVDREYIKNVLFQFLEHKDKRKYLMPAISKLLLLTKQQEGVFVSSLK